MRRTALLPALTLGALLAVLSPGWSAEGDGSGVVPDAPSAPADEPDAVTVCTEWCCTINGEFTCKRYVNPLPGTNPVATITDPLLGQPDLEERMRRLFNASPEVQG